MDSDQRKTRPITNLVRMCGNTFAVTRDGRKLDIRALPSPKPKVLPLPNPAQLLLFPRKD